MADKIKRAKQRPPFILLTHDFVRSRILNWNEKSIFMILQTYADSKSQCFPSISTLCKISGKSKNTVLKALKGLEDLKLLTNERRTTKNGKTSNLYTLYDYDEIWTAKSREEVTGIIDIENKRQQLYALAKELNCTITEKEPDSEPTNAHCQAPAKQFHDIDNNTGTVKSQDGQYTLEEIKRLFDYAILMADCPNQREDIDIAFSILYETLNTTKDTIRISGEDKPKDVVIAKLMKLTYYDIGYSIAKFHEQTGEIKNARAYLLTVLYHSREQSYLELMNRGHHNGDF